MRLIYLLSFLCCSVAAISQQTIRHIVYFDFDKGEPTPASREALIAFAEKIKTLAAYAADVNGFTDKRGSHLYNDDL